MRFYRKPFDDFDTTRKLGVLNFKDVIMLSISILSVSISAYSFHTVFFYHYFKKDVVTSDYIPDAFIFAHTLIVLYVANVISNKFAGLSDEDPKALQRRYAYIGLIVSIVAFSIRLTTLGFVANPEIYDGDFQYLFFCNFLFVLEIILWLLSIEFDVELIADGYKIALRNNYNNDILIAAGNMV